MFVSFLLKTKTDAVGETLSDILFTFYDSKWFKCFYLTNPLTLYSTNPLKTTNPLGDVTVLRRAHVDTLKQ